jgi:hypothetical protein
MVKVLKVACRLAATWKLGCALGPAPWLKGGLS